MADNQQLFLNQLTALFNKLTYLDSVQLETALHGFKPAEVHTLAFIAAHNDVNVSKIAAERYVTRGAASKMTRRLEARKLITRFQLPENKKEVYFRLTPAGTTIYRAHQKLDTQFAMRDHGVFADAAEMANVIAFLQKYNDHLDHEIELSK